MLMKFREICDGYAGINAHVYQKAATKGVQILFDHVVLNNINVILDGTFAYHNALKNIDRSLNHARQVEIFFVYQDPIQAWEFTKKREALEKRKVTKNVFIDAYFKSRENANMAKQRHGKNVKLTLCIKDFERDLENLEFNIDNIDNYIKKPYSRDQLQDILK